MEIAYWVWLVCLVGSVLYLGLDCFMRGGWGWQIGLIGIGELLIASSLYVTMLLGGVRFYAMENVLLIALGTALLFWGCSSIGGIVGSIFPLFIPLPGDG